MKADIRKSKRVIIFPEDKNINREVDQEILISENRTWVNIMHDGQEFSMSIENFLEMYELIHEAKNEVQS